MLDVNMETASQLIYVRPRSLAEAIAALSDLDAKIISGCTDVYPAHVGKALPARLLDVSAVAEMGQISIAKDQVRFGGAVTWSEIVAAKLPAAFRALQDAAKQVGSVQVQNRGTIAGNLCTASPAADGAPPLLVLDAEVELTSNQGVRRLALSDFILGYRKTALLPGELLSSIVVPVPLGQAASAFQKLGARKYLIISIVMVAALIRKNEQGKIVEARVAVGSASEKAMRLSLLEKELIGLNARNLTSDLIRLDHLSELKPIDDIRASAKYRMDAALHLIAETLIHVARE
jgi:CO/xanthine dehydrogenase FAD-binding subunit